MKKVLILRIINICLLLISALVIFLFSQENAINSTKTSHKVTEGIVNVLNKDNNIDEQELKIKIEKSDHIVRKLAHTIEFFIFGLCLINVIKDYKKINIKTVLICIPIGMLYAITDEIHQLFISGRGAQIQDIVIDTMGIVLGILVYCLFYKKILSKV